MIRIYGACAGLLAFAVAILRGLAADNPTETVLSRALYAMLIFLFLGSVIGWAGKVVVEEHHHRLIEEEARARKKTEAAEAKAKELAEHADAEGEIPRHDTPAVPEGAGLRAG